MPGASSCYIQEFTDWRGGWGAQLCAFFIGWDWLVRSWIRCGHGTAAARPCHCRQNHFAAAGEGILQPTDNPGREQILQRIGAALRTPSPHRSDAVSGEFFEPITNSLERFQQECAGNLMECTLTSDSASSALQLAKVLDSLPEGEVFVQDDPMLRQILPTANPARPIQWSSEGAPREASQATITLADALIAQTGSILVSASCGGRGASIIAPCHIVYATLAQLVPDLQTALANAYRQGILDRNSFACVISGSSRTADIEKILIQGAHGPRRLVVILQREN